jgi:hypothetical protein
VGWVLRLWSKGFGKHRLWVCPRFRGGIISHVLYANTQLAGHVIQKVFLKKQKQRFSSIIDDLEALAEVRPLSAQEIEIKIQSNADIEKLLSEEELKWYQRSKARFVVEGG